MIENASENPRPLRSPQRTRDDAEKDPRCDLKAFAAAVEIPGVPRDADDEPSEAAGLFNKRFGKHHLLWLKRLQDVEDGKIKRLMGLMPPGSAKSTYTSILFPVHVMGRFPNHQVIVASYGSDLPRKWGRKARSIVRQKAFRQIFDTTLSKESSAADEWALTNGSEYMGAGVLTGITGNRADGIVWDDLIRDEKMRTPRSCGKRPGRPTSTTC